jgi:biotin carboxyl carrier protein
MAMSDHERRRLTVAGPIEIVVELDPGAPEPASDRSAWAGTPEVRPLPTTALERAAQQARYEVTVDGWVLQVQVEPALQANLRERARRAGSAAHPHVRHVVRAQIPGRVVRLWVAVGQAVEAGERLLAVEAMKMENEVRAPRAGTVEALGATLGGTVELGDELATIS